LRNHPTRLNHTLNRLILIGVVRIRWEVVDDRFGFPKRLNHWLAKVGAFDAFVFQVVGDGTRESSREGVGAP
jgi:hypothetical protein